MILGIGLTPEDIQSLNRETLMPSLPPAAIILTLTSGNPLQM